MILVGRDHPMATCRAYAPRCRVVLYETQGPPEPCQCAHHKNGIKSDDRPENLEWTYPSDHARYHLTSERARILGRKGGRKTARLRRRAARLAREHSRRRRAA